jgi:hypothetical protein
MKIAITPESGMLDREDSVITPPKQRVRLFTSGITFSPPELVWIEKSQRLKT